MNVIKNLLLKFFHRFIVASYLEEIEDLEKIVIKQRYDYDHLSVYVDDLEDTRTDLKKFVAEIEEERDNLKEELAHLERIEANQNHEILRLKGKLRVLINEFVPLDQPLSTIEKQWSSFHENRMFMHFFFDAQRDERNEEDKNYYHEFIMGDGKISHYFQQEELDLLNSLSDWLT